MTKIDKGQRVGFVYPVSYPRLGGAAGTGVVMKTKRDGWVVVAPDRGQTVVELPIGALRVLGAASPRA